MPGRATSHNGKKSKVAGTDAEPITSSVDYHDGIIRMTLRGYITREVMRHVRKLTEHHIREAKSAGKRALLLIDLREVTGHNSGGRLAGKDLMMKLPFDRAAVFGGDNDLGRVAMYILRAAGILRQTGRYFKRENDAVAWVRSGKSSNYSALISRLAAIVAGFTAIAALFGWVTNNDILKHVYPSLKALNPVSAVCFILLAAVVYVISTDIEDRTKKFATVPVLVLLLSVAVMVLLRSSRFHIDVGVDRLLFTNKLVETGRPPALMSPRTAFTLLLLSLTLLLARRKTRRFQEASQVLLMLAFISVTLAIIGFSFGIQRLYNLTGTTSPTSLQGVIIGLVLAIGVFALYDEWMLARRFRRLNRALVLAVIVLCLAELLTGIAWRQATNKVRQDAATNNNQTFEKVKESIDTRFNIYVNALRGFQAFFQSSDYVSRKDYHDYFNSLKLDSDYSGFNSINFISYVRGENKQAFIDQQRNDQSLPEALLPDFTLKPDTGQEVQYIFTYAEPLKQADRSNFGLNVGTETSRLHAYELARDIGLPVASGPLTPLNQAQAKNTLSFFITIPVYQHEVPGTVAERRSQVVGYVNAAFRYQTLLGDLINKDLTPGAGVRVVDTETNKVVYEEGLDRIPKGKIDDKSVLLFTAGRPWLLEMYLPHNFGISEAENSLPLLLLLGGTFISVMMASLVGTLALGRDRAALLAERITEDLRNERNVALANQRKDEAILSSIGDAVFAIDMQGKITLFNPAAESISGYAEKDAIGKPYQKVLIFVRENSEEPITSFIERAMRGRATSMENHSMLKHKSGQLIPVADSAAPIRDSKGNMLGVIVVFRDKTNERELEKAKDEFVSLTSHQLRTPLTAIRLFSEMLSNDALEANNKQQADFAAKINISTARMIRLVGEILNVSRIELGELIIEPRPTDLAALIEDHIDELSLLARDRKARITFSRPANVPLADVDPDLLGQVFHNLLSNAIRYSKLDGGKITVELRVSGRNYVVSFTDNGIGIPKNDQKNVFDRFYRADNAVKTEADGTGLGLYLVKMIMKTAGGTVNFKSNEGQGTTFYVTIPLKGMKAKSGTKTLSKGDISK